MGKVGIFGGSFNPIHFGHLILAEYTLSSLKLDKILFIPNGNPPHKKTGILDKAHRYKMVSLAIKNNSNFLISDMEIKKETFSYTIETLKELREIYSNEELFFIMGTDSLLSFKSWYKYQEIIGLCNFAIFPRLVIHNDSIKKWTEDAIKEWVTVNIEEMESKLFFIEAPIIELSASLIRERIIKKQSVRYLVPDEVLSYIEDNGLI